MSDTVIQIEHLSKRYRLGVINNGTLWRDLQTWIALKRGREDPNSKIGENKYQNTEDYFWALKDISLEIKQGDRVGIIGKNGAGKSTLLKLLSRITSPTEGIIKIKGKVASLLEVGTGFHQELTGRENIYLNGAILGMKKRRIDQLIDEIIAFSGIECHIDTPVKRYSSGMFVRLAFAVAAHLDSDILIADEVLAVGDADFQKKALGKMHDLSTGQGRTVLFVSHNMGAVQNLCNWGVVLERGEIKYSGDIAVTIIKYLQPDNPLTSQSERIYVLDESKPFQVEKVEIVNKDGKQLASYETQEEIIIRIHCISRKPLPNLYAYFELQTNKGESLIVCDSTESGNNVFDNMAHGKHIVDLTIPKGLLAAGDYIPYLNFTSNYSAGFDVDSPMDVLRFNITDSISKRGNTRNALTATILDWNLYHSRLSGQDKNRNL
jgi:lipopolysaccharide transport system ATP-binding protein